MILRKYLSLLGIGSARVDLILPKETYKPGEQIKGHFLIEGGTIEQRIKRIECDLVLIDETAGTEKVVDSTTILTSKMILSEEMNHIPFTFRLPKSVPAFMKEKSYRFNTKLTFEKGIESKDQDIIQIVS
ncbi:sporulation protein [Domibacillus epiphyticus]|uniref:Sporulation protein n=1 Tax=Domibacillus epiphyticus TaxID=1714355 RepID=A0A1V2A7N4_9BACI|nr:sporulation protein [Domibacillus epiphyticus]OMP67009.1 sporulation protein [Domibacillus epiphyticus]